MSGEAAAWTKRCGRCREVKARGEFYKNRAKRDGLTDQCKTCSSEAVRTWREKNKDRKAATDRAYCLKNPEKVAARKRAQYEKNKERVSAQGRAWREKNKDRKAATDRAWNERNKERVAAKGRAWYEQNKERAVALSRAWKQNNLERRDAAYRAWYEKNKERAAAKRRAWFLKNPDKKAAADARRLAREASAPGGHSPKQLAARFAYFGNRCAYCGSDGDGKPLEVDHTIPLSKGGSQWPANLRPACKPHNSSKGGARPENWRWRPTAHSHPIVAAP